MAHNERAIQILNDLKSELDLHEIQNELIIQTNSPVVRSVPRNPKRTAFFHSLSECEDIRQRIMRYTKVTFSRRIISFIRHRLPKKKQGD